jgi:hypothetical protein
MSPPNLESLAPKPGSWLSGTKGRCLNVKTQNIRRIDLMRLKRTRLRNTRFLALVDVTPIQHLILNILKCAEVWCPHCSSLHPFAM